MKAIDPAVALTIRKFCKDIDGTLAGIAEVVMPPLADKLNLVRAEIAETAKDLPTEAQAFEDFSRQLGETIAKAQAALSKPKPQTKPRFTGLC